MLKKNYKMQLTLLNTSLSHLMNAELIHPTFPSSALQLINVNYEQKSANLRVIIFESQCMQYQ